MKATHKKKFYLKWRHLEIGLADIDDQLLQNIQSETNNWRAPLRESLMSSLQWKNDIDNGNF